MPRKRDPYPPSLPDGLPPYLSKRHVMAVFGWSERSLDRYRAAGSFPEPDPLPGRSLRWSCERLSRWVESLS